MAVDGLGREGGCLFLALPLVARQRHPFADDRPTWSVLGFHSWVPVGEGTRCAGRCHVLARWTSRSPCDANISQIASSQQVKSTEMNLCRPDQRKCGDDRRRPRARLPVR